MSDENSATNRSFHIGDVLSITTGHLVSPRHIEGVYDILNYLTDDNLMTHQLPRAADQCKPWLLRQHPDLAAVDATAVNESNWHDWLAVQVARFGESLAVSPLPVEEQRHRDPVDELLAMRPEGKVVILVQKERP